jgi:hypothetical protein
MSDPRETARVCAALAAKSLPTPEHEAPRHWEAYREAWGMRQRVTEEIVRRIAASFGFDPAPYIGTTLDAAVAQMADAPGVESCRVDEFSSRMCERGTKGCTVTHGVALSELPSVTLSGEDAHFLAVRLRRLCAHLNYALPKFAEDDASLINIAGTVIGALLTNMTHGVPAFDLSQPCALTPHGQPLATQCPRCKNPHHACDMGNPSGVDSPDGAQR